MVQNLKHRKDKIVINSLPFLGSCVRFPTFSPTTKCTLILKLKNCNFKTTLYTTSKSRKIQLQIPNVACICLLKVNYSRI